MKAQNKNFLYNIIYQLLTFFVPLITVPYVSRVLGAENVGIYSYTYSIVYIFMLFGMLGINNYGSRTIARVRDDKDELSKTFFSIYFFQLIINILALVIYFAYVLLIDPSYKTIYFIQAIFLISICFDINWFFFGLEKFKITITRNLIIKILSVILIFILVKDKSDLNIYTFIMSFSTLLSQVFLFIILPKYIIFKKVKFKEIFSHFKEVLYLFIPVLAFSIYKVMDKTMIGLFSSMTQVAYYEYAEKLMNIPTAIISALGIVMLPHMSYIMGNDKENYKKTIFDSMKLVSKLSTIMCLGLILISSDAVKVLFGNEFEESSSILILLSTTILASSWANVIRTQFLIPLKKDKVYIRSTFIAAIVNLILNVIFIRKYAAIGACIGTVISEFIVMFYQIFSTKKDLEYKKYMISLIGEGVQSLIIIMIAFVISAFIHNIYVRLIVKVFISVFLFILLNKEYIINDFLGKNKRVNQECKYE